MITITETIIYPSQNSSLESPRKGVVFTKKFPSRLEESKAPIHMLLRGYKEEFIKWKKMQTKKVDSIQKDRIGVLKNIDQVQFFKGLLQLRTEVRTRGMEC